jgi:fumarate reductase flavoprotein subunit
VFAADKTGFHLLHTLFQTSLKYERIERYDEFFVTKLLIEDGRCAGVAAIDLRDSTVTCFAAKAVILCTGGLGRIFSFTTNGAINTGDGMALAYRAGVPLKDMEFVQYHPTGLPGSGILMTEATRGEGGFLLNNQGRRFLEDYIPTKMELGPRDILSRAIMDEIEKGQAFDGPYGEYVHLDIRHLGEKKIDKRLPFVRELTTKFVGIDPVHEPIPVRPVVHYMMGGVDTDIVGRTPMAGLYAAGEAACVSINGANRLGSNSLTECLVFGARVGKQAAEDAVEVAAPAVNPLSRLAEDEHARITARYFDQREGGERIAPIRRELQATMEHGAGVFRTESSLKESMEEVARLKERFGAVTLDDADRAYNTELLTAIELANMLDVAETVLWSAVERRESRGSHTRRDYPDRDDGRFLKHSLAFPTKDGPPRIDYRDVTITRWPPAERKY